MFRNILVATDLTNQSASALVHARELGRIFGSKLIVAHIVDMPNALKKWRSPMFQDDLKSYREVLARQRGAAEAALDDQVSSLGLASKGGVRCIVRAGDTATELAALIEEQRADLTVVGRGRGGRLGPVAEQLVRIVGRAVLVTPVRPPRIVRASRRSAA